MPPHRVSQADETIVKQRAWLIYLVGGLTLSVVAGATNSASIRACGSATGLGVGRTCSAKRAMSAASSRSVLASRPIVTLPGDTNGDEVVDLEDLNNVRNNFGGTGLGDADSDLIVDLNDLNYVRNHFGAGAAEPVPEPLELSVAWIAAAFDIHQNVEGAHVLGQFERLAHDHASGLAREELVDRLLVDDDLPAALLHEHAGDRGLAPSRAVVVVADHVRPS
mgnify:CR=1 FL=1